MVRFTWYTTRFRMQIFTRTGVPLCTGVCECVRVFAGVYGCVRVCMGK